MNPVAYIVEAERVLFTGSPAGPAVARGAVAASAVAVVGLVLGVRAMRRTTLWRDVRQVGRTGPVGAAGSRLRELG